jgi:hypothetical protein
MKKKLISDDWQKNQTKSIRSTKKKHGHFSQHVDIFGQ